MKIFRVFTIIVISLGLFACAQADLKVGQTAPDFTLKDGSGATHTLSEYQGKIVVLEWFNKDCPFVKKHYGSQNMQTLQKTYTAKDVVWLTIISSAQNKQGYLTKQEALALPKQNGMSPTALLLDPSGKVGRLYQAKTTPHMFVINPQGKIEYMGAIDDKPSTDQSDISGAKNYVATAVNQLLKGEKVTITQAKPYGCSVKYK